MHATARLAPPGLARSGTGWLAPLPRRRMWVDPERAQAWNCRASRPDVDAMLALWQGAGPDALWDGATGAV